MLEAAEAPGEGLGDVLLPGLDGSAEGSLHGIAPGSPAGAAVAYPGGFLPGASGSFPLPGAPGLFGASIGAAESDMLLFGTELAEGQGEQGAPAEAPSTAGVAGSQESRAGAGVGAAAAAPAAAGRPAGFLPEAPPDLALTLPPQPAAGEEPTTVSFAGAAGDAELAAVLGLSAPPPQPPAAQPEPLGAAAVSASAAAAAPARVAEGPETQRLRGALQAAERRLADARAVLAASEKRYATALPALKKRWEPDVQSKRAAVQAAEAAVAAATAQVEHARAAGL